MALSARDRQQRLREKRALDNLYPVTVYVKPDDRADIQRCATALHQYAIVGLVVRNRRTGRLVTMTLDEF